MEITKIQLRELMAKSFKFGQQKYEANGFAIRLWIEGEIEKILRRRSLRKRNRNI